METEYKTWQEHYGPNINYEYIRDLLLSLYAVKKELLEAKEEIEKLKTQLQEARC